MMLYLLVVVLGNVNSQTLRQELSPEDGNQTATAAGAGTTKAGVNLTRLLEEEPGVNHTFVTEDDERFQDQDQEFWDSRCQEEELKELSHIYCGQRFHTDMEPVSPEDRCVLEEVMRPYNELMLCLELLSDSAGCYYPNPITEDFFLSIHSNYFHNCSKDDLLFEDAPHELVVALTLVPVSLIPVLVYLVVCKSGVKE
ncbi:receptor activity-modifying protein 3-like [Cyclopterus lumpus]|uniref:Si:ch73-334d15.2 n=1 Tax=Cyclopterus lumpus TaxID=8103 RepID=A0A8C2WG25_CYCLU|nr:receptor activity-modifying protein 3-like [Cyclopterus lumpus]